MFVGTFKRTAVHRAVDIYTNTGQRKKMFITMLLVTIVRLPCIVDENLLPNQIDYWAIAIIHRRACYRGILWPRHLRLKSPSTDVHILW